MDPQTRSVLKAALIGLAISIAVVTINVLQEGRLSPIDPYQIFNGEIIGYWAGRLGALPLICVIGTIMYSFSKTPIVVSAVNLLGAAVGITLAIAAGVVAVAAVYPTAELPFVAGADRDNFIKNAMASCVRKQRGLPQNRNVSDGAINTFCSCYTHGAADATTREDLQYQAKYGTMSPNETKMLTAAYNKCVLNVR